MATHRYGTIGINYTVTGKGPDLVLLHAGGSSGAQWRKVAAELEDDFRLIMPDFIGYGASDAWPGPGWPSHDDQAAAIASLVAEECGGQAHVVGHSFGGAVAARFVLSSPQAVSRLVLIEPVLTPLLNQASRTDIFAEYEKLARYFVDNAEDGREEEAWRYFIDYRNGTGTWDGLSDKARARFLAGTKSAVDTYRANLANPTTLEDCRSITAPTMVLCGGNTTEPDRVVTEILRDTLPNNTYQVLPGAEHMSPLTHPDLVASAVRAHLAEGS